MIMRFLLNSIFILTLANPALADCDWSKIKNNGDGTYTYSKDLHICVGEMKQDVEIKDKQIQDFRAAIGLKDTALALAEQRTQLWMDTSFKMNDRLNTIENMRSTNNWMYFGLGALTVLATGFMVAELNKN